MSLALPETDAVATLAPVPGRSDGPGAAAAALVPDAEHRPLAPVGLAAAALDDPDLQRVFWLGLFGLFLGGFEFMGLNDALFNGIFEYLFSMFFLSILGDALLLDRDHHLHGAVPLARGGVPADDAGDDRPDLRLQVRRGDRALELGLLPAGQPADGRPTA